MSELLIWFRPTKGLPKILFPQVKRKESGIKGMHTTTGPQLPNCQTQYHFSWLVVSPLRQKSTRSGNLVLAGILAFLCRQNRLSIPPRPSRYLHFSSAHGRCTTGILLVDVGAHSPLAACTFLKVIQPSQVFSDVIYVQ